MWWWFGSREDLDELTRNTNLAALGGLFVGLGVSSIWSLVMNPPRH